MNELGPKLSPVPIRVALAGVILAVSINSRVFAQGTSSDTNGTSISTSTDTVAAPATESSSGITSTDTASDSATPTATPSGSSPDASITAATTSGTGNPGDYEGPIGVTGIFNGNTTTAGEYDPLTHSARREIDDIVVPGSIGKYPLKMTRYYNSRAQYYALSAIGLGHGWAHEYSWLLWAAGHKVVCPHGSIYDDSCDQPVGVSEGWESHSGPNGTWRLADGGRVVLTNGRATSIIDPYGLTTTITYDSTTGLRTRVTEPGGRYLAFTYGDTDQDGTRLLTTVDAYDGRGNRIDWVTYSYTLVSPGGSGASMKMLTGVNYSDGTSATYTYRSDNVTEDTALGTFKIRPLLQTCNDVRYSGPMRQIVYQYQSGGPHGVILSEKNLSTGSAVSTIAPGLPTYGLPSYDPPTLFTETRGDSPTRTFTYTRLRSQRNTEGGVCPDYSDDPHQQMLLSYTDFQRNTTYLGYDANWYINAVTDARWSPGGNVNYTTTYLRGPPPPQGIGQILQITHPDGSYIAYSYFPDPHYLQTVTDERRNLTTYKRDSNNRVFEIDHPDGGVETFSYNAFGQVLTHRLANNSDVNGNAQARYKHFQYDSRGLLTAEWNPTINSTPLASDPKTTYTYYNASDPAANYVWIDRVKTKTPPANAQGLINVETYEYDRKLDSTNAPCAGRGLVTKVTHPNDKHGGTSGTSRSFSYDQYGNKIWEENELLQHTTYTYDNYNRLKTVTLPSPGGTTTYDYLSYLHTTNSAYFVTDPVGILTANTYDANWRKTSTTVGSATTRFGYDAVGNQTQVTDPRGTALGDPTYTTVTGYDARNRKTSITDPQGHFTSFYYEDNINLTRIVRPDGSAETKHYDLMNRVDSDTVPKTGPPASPTETITTTFAYNPSGSLKSVTVPQTASLNLTTRFGYDPSDLKTTMLYPNGSDTQGWTYDNVKNLRSRRTVNGTTQSFSYDSRNRKIGMTWSNSADSATFDYDAAGRLITANNPSSAITRQYDAAGRLTLDRQKVGTLAIKDVQYSYDAAGKQTCLYLTSAAYDYTFSYDPMGRFEKIFLTSPSTLWFQYYYDLASNETQRFNYLSSVAQLYTPDNLNRMSRRDVKKGTTTLSSEVYGYDAMSRLNSVVREDGYTDQFGYYLDGELYWAKYNLAATPTPTPSPTASPTPTPTPTPGGQVATPGFSGPASLTCAYSVTVSISTTTSGAQIRYTIDGTTPTSTHGTLISASSGSATFSIAGGTTLQAMAFKSGMTDSAVRSGYWERDCGQSPDATEAWNTPRNVTYTIDKSGNRTQVVDNGVAASYVPNNLNQYTLAKGSAVTLGTEHEIAAFQNINYTYLNDERLKSVISGSNNYQLAYDALGRCVKRTLNNVITYYVYDGEKPIVEYNSAGTVVAKNLYGKGIDEILRRDDYTVTPTRTFYCQQDHAGSVTHLTDATGAVTEKYKYDAFGAPTIYDPGNAVRSTSAYKNRFLFTGREYASTFGIYEYRARAYHPGLGRFTSEDPMGFAAGDYNLFRYVHNDPLDLTDPMGLEDIYVSREMDRLGVQASLNSRFASIAARDGQDRSQVIQEKGGHLSLQNRFWTGENETSRKFEGGRWKSYVSQKETAWADEGHRAKGIGHVHMDKTGKPSPHDPDWSKTDRATAQGSRDHVGRPVYKVLESDPTKVERLTPQTNPKDAPTAKVINAGQFEPAIQKGTQDADTHSRHIPLPESH